MLDDFFIFFLRELANTLSPDEKSQDVVTTDVALVCTVSKHIPLCSARHELLMSQLTLNDQLLSLTTNFWQVRWFVDA